MQAFKTAVFATCLVAVAGCADVGPLFEWDPYFVRQRDMCIDGWYGYWDQPCPLPPVKPVAAAPSGYTDELFALQQQNAALRRRISELELQIAARDRELNQAKASIADLERQPAAAPKAAIPPGGKKSGSGAQLETAKQGLIRALRPQIEKGDITVDLNNERLLINLASSYLFGSGEAELKPGGAEALKKVGEILKDYPEYKVAVEGHTDNRPIRSTLKKKFETNHELSEARAANAAKALAEGGRSALSTAGFADTKPMASNSTEAGRAKNRRVEIRVTE